MQPPDQRATPSEELDSNTGCGESKQHRRWLALVLLFASVFGVSLGVREVNRYTVAVDAPAARSLSTPERGADYYSADPDSHYHMRRLDLALQNLGAVSTRDPLLSFPDFEDQGGAPIPWPRLYTRVLHGFLSPFAPPEPAARTAFVEQNVARAPQLLGALTSFLVALAAYGFAAKSKRWSGQFRSNTAVAISAALGAGLYHAFCFASLRYTRLGNGDHHAWVALLQWSMLWIVATSLAPTRLRSMGRSWLAGCAAGVLAGAALSSWVAALLWIGLVDLALAWRMFTVRPSAVRGLGGVGVAFHLAALFVILPEVAGSPFDSTQIINLSAFHIGFLGLGALVCLPLVLLGGRATPAGIQPAEVGIPSEPRPALRLYPRILCGVFVLSAVGCFSGDLGRSLREGIEWATGTNHFMGYIYESQPLGWGLIGGLDASVYWLGWGLLAVPIALFTLARRSGGDSVPIVIVLVAQLGLALTQRRFAMELAAPLSFALGLMLATALANWTRRAPAIGWGLAILVPLLCHSATVDATLRRGNGQVPQESAAQQRERGLRGLCRWLGETDARSEAVLAQWDLGHMVEWGAGRPTLANNFGLYLGEDSFLDPWRFLMQTEFDRAEQLCEQRRVGHVLLASDWERNWDTMGRVLGGELGLSHGGLSLVRRLLPLKDEHLAAAMPQPGFLRLVALGELAPTGEPSGWVWEVVRGAVLEVEGDPGQVLRGMVRRQFRDIPGERKKDYVWLGAALVDASGRARLRVPWSTEDESSGRAAGPLEWAVGERAGSVHVPLDAVLGGGAL